MKAIDTLKAIQTLLHVVPDGQFGPKSDLALTELRATEPDVEWPPVSEVHTVKATSFADPADVKAFRKCKAAGGSDQDCFKVGDNGVGKWGDDCTQGNGPICALPPEEWQQFGAQARGKKVIVTHGDKQVIAGLRDTMPHYASIHNGAGIDLNPDACDALGISIPAEARVTWQWA